MTSAPPAAARLAVRCRALRDGDEPALVRLLLRGFPERPEAYWTTAVERLFRRAGELALPPGVVLVHGDDLVGTLLLIPGGPAAAPRCNLSSWFVDPRFAVYAPLLANQATRRGGLTYINVSPAPNTWATIEAQGFRRYSHGRIAALPALMGAQRGARVRIFAGGADHALPPEERDLLTRHVGFGCRALVVEAHDGAHPFLVLPWRIGRWLPGAKLVYCRDLDDLRRFGGVVGRYLLRRGMPVLLVDACGPVDGIPGSRIGERSPKYAKGAHPPRTGDLTDTEIVMFGP